ncbi:MAG TPA: sugar transporter [Prevotellaceae bacterium]|nr:sugar transporter [Prevotellaceae bacterium]
MSERVHRSIMNIKVGMVFYTFTLILAFFSRKIFLDCLGAEFIGLTGMLMNIMSYLSVAELGIGTSIVYFLYKPLQEDDHKKINEVMSMLAFLYRCIGCVILAIGIIVSLFFPWWFDNLSTGLPLVYFAFYSFLLSSAAGYIFNYKQLLVSANQKQYLVSSYFQSISILQSITQILLAWYYRNLWLWVVVGLVFTVIGIIVFNIRIRQIYPWLNINLAEGRRNLKKYPEVLKKSRQVFMQKFKDLMLFRSDEILVGAFVSVTHVALYGNYTVVTSKLNFLVNILGEGLNAGVGNLIAEGNEHNIMKVFWEMTAARYLILGIVIFPLLMFLQAFVGCWFGTQYQLDELIVNLLILNIFLLLHNGTVLIFIGANGMYSDIWAVWTEFFLNITITLILAPYYGIVGILLGKIVSIAFSGVIWKPYFLFTSGFHKSVAVFWKGMIPYYISFFSFVAIAILVRNWVVEPYADSLINLTLIGILVFIPIILCYFFSLFFLTKGMKYFVARKPFLYNAINKLHL